VPGWRSAWAQAGSQNRSSWGTGVTMWAASASPKVTSGRRKMGGGKMGLYFAEMVDVLCSQQ